MYVDTCISQWFWVYYEEVKEWRMSLFSFRGRCSCNCLIALCVLCTCCIIWLLLPAPDFLCKIDFFFNLHGTSWLNVKIIKQMTPIIIDITAPILQLNPSATSSDGWADSAVKMTGDYVKENWFYHMVVLPERTLSAPSEIGLVFLRNSQKRGKSHWMVECF